MIDVRTIISGVLALVALVGTITSIVLAVDPTQISQLVGLASTFGAYALANENTSKTKRR